jgi:hypothetical protein
MKNILRAAALLITLSVSTIAFAAPPVCGAGDAKGTVCWSNSNPSSLQTSCGNGNYTSGSVTNAGTLDDRCGTNNALVDAGGNPIKRVPVKAPMKQEKATVQ